MKKRNLFAKAKVLAIMVIGTVLMSSLSGCVSYYVQPQLPDSEIATICGSVKGPNVDGDIYMVGIAGVDGTPVERPRNSGLDYPIRLLPGLRFVHLNYLHKSVIKMGFSPDEYRYVQLIIQLNALAGHKYETKYRNISKTEVEFWIEDQQTKEKQALKRAHAVR